MVQGNVTEISNKAHEVLTDTLNRALEAFSVGTELNKNLWGQASDVSAAVAREGMQYLGDLQGTLRQASEQALEIWNRQWTLAQDFPKDPMSFPQKAATLCWQEGDKMIRLGDAQRGTLSRYTGSLQNHLEKSGTETRETFAKYTEKLLTLYDLKN